MVVNLSSLWTKFSVASVWCIQNQLATSGTNLGELKFFDKICSNIMAFSVLNSGVHKPAIATFYEHNGVPSKCMKWEKLFRYSPVHWLPLCIASVKPEWTIPWCWNNNCYGLEQHTHKQVYWNPHSASNFLWVVCPSLCGYYCSSCNTNFVPVVSYLQGCGWRMASFHR